MARTTYPAIIDRDPKFTALADISLRLALIDKLPIMTTAVDLVPDEYLDLLADKWSVTGFDGWLLATTPFAKRELIKGAVELHRHKGTPWSIREVVRKLGFGEIDIDEHLHPNDPTKWAHYKIVIHQPITNRQAALIRKTLRAFAPARCVLEVLDFTEATLFYDGQAVYDGQYNHGTA